MSYVVRRKGRPDKQFKSRKNALAYAWSVYADRIETQDDHLKTSMADAFGKVGK